MVKEFCKDVIDKSLDDAGIDFGRLDIQELWQHITLLEQQLGVRYLRMDFGVPGLPPPVAAVNAQVEAIFEHRAVSQYPPGDGLPALKKETATFLHSLLGVPIYPECCFPTCGATEAAFVAQAVGGRRYRQRSQILHLDPGYPPIKAQTQLLGLELQTLDLYGCRGEKLINAIESIINDGHATAISWSSPNNPTSAVLSEEELHGIGRICESQDIIAIEDAAYLGMVSDARNDLRNRWHSISQHTNNFFILLSASKMLSYAGERIGMLVTSESLVGRDYGDLDRFFACTNVGCAIKRTIFNLTAGAPHSAQYAVASALNQINQGKYDFVGVLGEYGRRARIIHNILRRSGFYIVYESDSDEGAGGFYVTFAYPGLTATQLIKELLYHGITVLPLSLFGSCHKDGVRACVGLLDKDDVVSFEQRISEFSRSQIALSV